MRRSVVVPDRTIGGRNESDMTAPSRQSPPAVEREQQRVALLSLGCSLAQGFLFSPAVPHEEITAMLLAPPAAAVLPLHVLRLDGPSPKDASLPA